MGKNQPDLKGVCETLGAGELSWLLLGRVKLVRQKEAETAGARGTGMGVAGGSVGLRGERPKVPMGCSQVSSNPWGKGTLARWDFAGRAAGKERHLGPADQVGCPGCYLGLRARCRFKRLTEAFWHR